MRRMRHNDMVEFERVLIELGLCTLPIINMWFGIPTKMDGDDVIEHLEKVVGKR